MTKKFVFPHGSVLGQLLFLLFINDLPEISKNNVVLLADATYQYGEVSEENYDLDLNNIETWMAAN